MPDPTTTTFNLDSMSLNEPITTTFHLDESDRKEAPQSSLSVDRSFSQQSISRPTTPSITEPTLPPVSSRSQPLGFGSPQSDNRSINQSTLKKARTARGRVVQSFQLALHACQQTDNQSNTQTPVNNQIIQNPDEPQSIKQSIESFRSLTSINQTHFFDYCLQAQQNRPVDNLIDSLIDCLIDYFLDCSTGQPDDVVCQWLYEIYLTGSNQTTSQVSPATTNQSLSQSISKSVLFVLHLVPILVYSLIFRVTRSINCAGLSAVLLAIYNTHRSKNNLSVNQAINQSLGLSSISGAPLVDTAKFARNPYGSTNFTPGPSINQTSNQSLTFNYRPLTSLDLESVSVLSSVVLAVLVGRMSLMNKNCAQQFCALSIKLLSSNESDEVLNHSNNQAGNETTELSLLNWKHTQGESINHRYNLSNDLLQVIVVGLTFCLSGFPAAQTIHHSINQTSDLIGIQNLALISLRGVHCRAVEELLPEILLQTTPLLEAVEE